MGRSLHFENIKNIGNLVLLDAGLNSIIGNKSFEFKKKKIIENSTIYTTRAAIKDKDSWLDREIEERTNYIIEEYYKLKY